MTPEKLPAEPVPEKFYAVLNLNGTEGVLFKDKADAKFTATGEHERWGTPTIGEAFRNSYAEDGSMTVREVLLSSPAATAFPDALTPDLSYVLGMPNFRCAPYAAIFRGAGHDIPCKAEAEQAFVIHRMVLAVLQHGAGWDAAFAAELHAAADSAKEAATAGLQKGGA